MEVLSLGICALESLNPYTSVLRSENVGSKVHLGGKCFQRKVKLSRNQEDVSSGVSNGITNEQTVWDESSSRSPWGIQSRVPAEHHSGTRHTPHALSLSPVARPVVGTRSAQSWRLEDEILDLKELMKRLQAASCLEEKIIEIDKNRRVRALFGGYGNSGIYVNPAIDLAMRVLNTKDLFLLKCMVASGQEHVLDVSSDFSAAFFDIEKGEEKTHTTLGKHPSSLSEDLISPIKGAFSMLANMIMSWDESSEDLAHMPIGQWRSPSMDTKVTVELEEINLGSGESVVMVQRLIKALTYLLEMLGRVDKFYDSIGGIIGYQVAALELIKASEQKQDPPSSQWTSHGAGDAGKLKKRFSVPFGPDLSTDQKYASQAASWGLEGLPEMAEFYPLGGAGDRLGLVDEVTGECLPVAMLPYCGRTLLEGLIRDLQAREYLYYKVNGTQHVTPVAIMTSAAKKNNERVHNLCESLGWFGRGRHNFRLFEQPLVPAVAAADGRWMVSEPLTAVLKPGGHGVIWKLASDEGVFDWLFTKGRKAAIVRQISNPMAGVDTTLLALSGVGLKYNKKFGFASCRRNVGAAEGVNVMTEQNRGDGSWEYAITCIEYTEFSKLGIADVPVSSGSLEAQYPANTNVLYVDLAAVEHIASSQTTASLPGMIMNLKKPIVYLDQHGLKHSVRGGRIECTMQNVADLLINRRTSTLSSRNHEDLDTFVIYNDRRKVTSSAKRRPKPNDVSLHQTPDGSFLDVTRNAHELLTSCGIRMPEMAGNHCYVDTGPPFIALLHPALGPIWDVTRQKISGGSMSEGSELQLEIAEFSWRNVELNGSLRVQATNAMGSIKTSTNCAEGMLQYGIGCARCRLQGVQIKNKGVDWNCGSNVYWQHQVQRIESLEIILEGNAEFEAVNVILEGSHKFEVPDGHHMHVTSDAKGLTCKLTPLSSKEAINGSWYWQYDINDTGNIRLNMVEA